MPGKASNAIHTENGHAIIGGRPGTGTLYRDTTSWGAPLPDSSRVQPAVKARGDQPLPVADPNALPLLSVARQVVARAAQKLRAQAEGIEREISRGAIGATGMVVPGLVERQAANRVALDEIRAEIARLESLSDHDCRVAAFEMGYR